MAGKRPPFDFRSSCPISSLLDLLGDRWTLLVVRDLFFANAHRFGDFLKSPERIPTNLLADRLRRLEKAGIVRKAPYQKRPIRYEYFLTPMGGELLPVLTEMSRWSLRHIPGTFRPPPEGPRRADARRRFRRDPAVLSTRDDPRCIFFRSTE